MDRLEALRLLQGPHPGPRPAAQTSRHPCPAAQGTRRPTSKGVQRASPALPCGGWGATVLTAAPAWGPESPAPLGRAPLGTGLQRATWMSLQNRQLAASALGIGGRSPVGDTQEDPTLMPRPSGNGWGRPLRGHVLQGHRRPRQGHHKHTSRESKRTSGQITTYAQKQTRQRADALSWCRHGSGYNLHRALPTSTSQNKK